MDPAQPSAKAKAVVLLHDRIINVGDSTEITKLAGSETRTLNLHGGDLVVLEDDPYKTSASKISHIANDQHRWKDRVLPVKTRSATS
jgi:hypothetical protein